MKLTLAAALMVLGITLSTAKGDEKANMWLEQAGAAMASINLCAIDVPTETVKKYITWNVAHGIDDTGLAVKPAMAEVARSARAYAASISKGVIDHGKFCETEEKAIKFVAKTQGLDE